MKTNLLLFVLLLAKITSVFSQNYPPIAVNDTVVGIYGYKIHVNFLANDFDPDGDSIYVWKAFGFTQINDSVWEMLLMQYNEDNYDSLIRSSYTIRDQHDSASKAYVVIRLRGIPSYDFIDRNNIRALISPFGNHFWNLDKSCFEVPKGSGKMAVLNQTLWIGGIDNSDSLHLAAERYRIFGKDFSAGPVSSIYDSSYLLNWNRVWKINKTDINYHINNWNHPGYKPSEVILKWPGNGDPLSNQSPLIAPFYDVNADNIYDPLAGDYPIIRGDQAVFFVFNDARSSHSESYGVPLEIEVHGMAYEYDQPDDSAIANTLFMHYDIVNRSAKDFHDTYLGFYTDFDLGFSNDDYIGCDVTNGMMYAYNGLAIDGSGQSGAYGAHPPAIGMKFIGGPYLEPDGIDNPGGMCDFSINGLNFDDGIVDNERMGMTNFLYYPNSDFPIWEPNKDTHYYNNLRSIWPLGEHIIFGGNGHQATGGTGPDCNYMFPGDSDTLCNWGTNGILPNGGFNQNGYFWNEETAWNQPSDRRGVASIGPFNFNAGESIPIDYCFTWARDYQGDHLASVNLLRERIAGQKPHWNNLIQLPISYFRLDEDKQEVSISIYPNPMTKNSCIFLGGDQNIPFFLFAISGVKISEGMLKPGINPLDVSMLPPGIYLLKCAGITFKLICVSNPK